MANDSHDQNQSPFGIPGAGNLHEVIASMQKAWGFAGSQPMAPTLDVDEIDQRLKDLKAVAQWLSLNQNMLQSSIQALQVQRATIMAIKSFTSPPGSGESADATITPMDMMQAFSNAFAGSPTAPDSAPTPSISEAEPPSAPSPGVNPPVGSGLDPQQWWAMLQEQFAQVASSALSEGEPKKPSSRARKSSARTQKK